MRSCAPRFQSASGRRSLQYLELHILKLNEIEFRLHTDVAAWHGTVLPGRDDGAVEPHGYVLALARHLHDVPLSHRPDVLVSGARDLHAFDFAVDANVAEQIGDERRLLEHGDLGLNPELAVVAAAHIDAAVVADRVLGLLEAPFDMEDAIGALRFMQQHFLDAD